MKKIRNACNFLSKNSNLVDAIAKIFGVALAVFYVAQYAYDISREHDRSTKKAAISYIERFNQEEIVSARESVANFWVKNAEISKLALQRKIANNNFDYYVVAQLAKESQTHRSLNRVGYFFDEVYFCLNSGNCDQNVTMSFFCDAVTGYEENYFRLLRKRRSNSLGRNLYNGTLSFYEKCKSLSFGS